MNEIDPQAQFAAMQQQLAAVAAENQQLRAELEQIHRRQEMVGKVVRGGAGLLIPLLDRAKVVRAFGQLVQTVSGFAGPREGWPTRDQIIGDARSFGESCVRFAVRRRTVVMLFSLLATAIPAIQIWLVVQQNRIIENQTKFSEIQVYDIVSRSMTEGDRNAQLMTSALLSRADVGFLRGVIDEAFHPNLGGVFREEGVEAAKLRLEDAAFRGNLVRAVVRTVEVRAPETGAGELYTQVQPMLHRILDDAQGRVPAVLRIGRGDLPPSERPELPEQIDGYLVQVGEAMRIYGRLARETGEEEAFFADIGAYLRRADDVNLAGNHFAGGYRYGLEALLLEMAVEPDLEDPPVDLGQAGLEVDAAWDKGIAALKAGIGDDVDWAALRAQMDAGA